MKTRKYSEYVCLTCSDPYLYPTSCANKNDCFYDEYKRAKLKQPNDYASQQRAELVFSFFKFLLLGVGLWALEPWLLT